MKISLWLAGVALVAVHFAVGPAFAADMPVKAKPIAYSWAGWYAGANIGHGFGKTTSNVTTLPDPATFNEAPFSMNLNSRGVLGGLQAGYNWQINHTVIGLEADISYSGIKNDGTFNQLTTFGGVPFAGAFQTNSQRMDWFGTLRARTGFLANDHLLVYATGGAAFGRVKYEAYQQLVPAPNLQFSGSTTKTKVGWTLGGGAEWAAGGNWTVKAEYLYYDLGNETVTQDRVLFIPADSFKVVSDFKTKGHIVRVGLNYLFH